MTADLRERHNTGLSHQALFYSDAEELLDSVARFIGAGVAADEPTLAVLSADKIERLKQRIPHSGGVSYRDIVEVGRNPARIISVWHDFVRAHDGSARTLRAIGEPVWRGRSPEELEECRIHEELLNVVFETGAPWRFLCPYDTSSLEPTVVDCARASHLHPDTHHRREEPLQLLEGTLAAPPDDLIHFEFDADRLRALRKLALREATRAGVSGRSHDFVFAVNEVATDSLTHGGGRGDLRLWQTDRGVVCEILDRGRIRDPLVGRRRPPIEEVVGHGLWLANQLCDLVQVRSHPVGTVVRIHMHGE